MVTDELSRLMQEGGPEAMPGPDLARVHARGRRRRRLRRGGAALTGAVLVAGVVGAASLVGGGPGTTAPVPPADRPTKADTLSSYERQVLAAVPDAYAVGGTVVVPGAVDPTSEDFLPITVTGPVVDLGFHAFPSTRYVPTRQTYPKVVDDASEHDIIRVDAGEVSLACVTSRGSGEPCRPAVVAHLPDGAPFYLYGLGKDEFLQPDAEMELFLDHDYSDRRTDRTTLIGGFDGTSATSVQVQLVDGTIEHASLDRGTISAGDTLFWARTPVPVAAVRAYDDRGALVDSHVVRACNGGVDCEVR